MYLKTYEDEDGNQRYYETSKLTNYKLALSRCGVVYRQLDHCVGFYIKSEFIKKVISYGNGYGKILQRHQGFIHNNNARSNHFQIHFPHDKISRWCIVIKDLIKIKDEDLQGVM
jgi:hypothetical protein